MDNDEEYITRACLDEINRIERIVLQNDAQSVFVLSGDNIKPRMFKSLVGAFRAIVDESDMLGMDMVNENGIIRIRNEGRLYAIHILDSSEHGKAYMDACFLSLIEGNNEKTNHDIAAMAIDSRRHVRGLVLSDPTESASEPIGSLLDPIGS